MNEIAFDEAFAALTGNPPFPWQHALYVKFAAGEIPQSCNLPTGLGKTSVIAVWLIARANGANVPRRLVYVVNRRTVVDQTTDEVEKYKKNLAAAGITTDLALSTLRGQFADNREWSADPSRPAVICGTVDMIGSRLLFSGYGVGFKGKPLHAGFLGQDALLIHDEAHLEPAFQKLLFAIEGEQKAEQRKSGRTEELPWPKLQVMELTATSRSDGASFELTPAEKTAPVTIPAPPEKPAKETPLEVVHRRIRSKKGIEFHPHAKDQLTKKIDELVAAKWKDSGKAILIFVRTVADVEKVEKALKDQSKKGSRKSVQVLTGTLRGLERDRLAESDPIFARFVAEPRVLPQEGTVYLVCTSAGEVGVDLSADHLISDLTTLDSMLQRFGRVNRRGLGQAELDILYEAVRDDKKKADAYEMARWATKTILERLPACRWDDRRREAAPIELSSLNLTTQDRKAAFAPEPDCLPATDILFDAWALTTIKGKLPGRPPVEPYLHGVSEFDPPQTTVAWRREVEWLTDDILAQHNVTIEDVLERFPLKPHEELSGPTYGKNKVFEQLEQIASRDAKLEPEKQLSAWVVDADGTAERHSLQTLVQREKQNKPVFSLAGRTVILPPRAGGFRDGMLCGEEGFNTGTEYDVAEEWYADRERTVRHRVRRRTNDPKPEPIPEMRLAISLDLTPDADTPEVMDDGPTEPNVAEPSEEAAAGGRYWNWYVRLKSADGDASKSSDAPVTWQHHTDDVVGQARKLADMLFRNQPTYHRVVVIAARYHDFGKKREVWQRSIGNPNPTNWHAKSGKDPKTKKLWRPTEITDYRHEFGSLVDLELSDDPEFQSLDQDAQELVRHLIATHHGFGRPHFPDKYVFDPAPRGVDVNALAMEVPRGFARLQRKYGRWGLAYLESLLRAADWAASAKPSSLEKGVQS